MLKSAIKGILLVVFIATVGALIYANFFAPRYSQPMFIAAGVAGVVWWLMTYQVLTDKGKDGYLTYGARTAVSRKQAESVKAEGDVVAAEARLVEETVRKTGAEYNLKEATSRFDRNEELERALHENKLLIARRATEKGIAVADYTSYLLTVLQEQTKYETARMIAFTELEKERKKLVETIRFTLQEGSLKFDESMELNDKLVKLDEKIKKSRNKEERNRLGQQRQILEAKWNELVGQINLPKTDGAQA